MKIIRLVPFALFVPLGMKWACSPPRPHENAPLESSSGAGGPGGSSSLPDVPKIPKGLGGADAMDPRCEGGADTALAFTKENLLASIAACTRVRLCEFEHSAIVLSNRAEEFSEDPADAKLEIVRSAFFDAMLRWARLELFQFGPQASAKKDPEAGQGVRDLIYPWPNVSRCRVEEQVFGRAYESAGFDDLVKVPINSRGLFAVEYLSFYEGSDNDCTQFSVTNAEDAWNQTSASDLTARKHAYLKAVTNDVAARSIDLSDRWDPEGGDFSGQLTSASAYPDQQTALNLVAHALLYLEVEVKDYKLGAPAGLYENAPVDLPELSFAHGGTELLKRNLEGFRDLFVGCSGEGLGFDDWLSAVGHEDLSADIVADLDAADAFLETFPDLSAATNAQLLELHAVIKRLTDHLKSELFGQGSPIGLTLPTAVEGDTD